LELKTGWFMVLSATFNNISAISWGQFYCLRKLEYPKKTTDLSQDTDKLYHIMLYRVHNREIDHNILVTDITEKLLKDSQHNLLDIWSILRQQNCCVVAI
jgi:hypothetical protein